MTRITTNSFHHLKCRTSFFRLLTLIRKSSARNVRHDGAIQLVFLSCHHRFHILRRRPPYKIFISPTPPTTSPPTAIPSTPAPASAPASALPPTPVPTPVPTPSGPVLPNCVAHSGVSDVPLHGVKTHAESTDVSASTIKTPKTFRQATTIFNMKPMLSAPTTS